MARKPRTRKDRISRMVRLMSNPDVAELSGLYERMERLGYDIYALCYRHDDRCKCELCRFVSDNQPVFPNMWATLHAAATTLVVLARDIDCDRPQTLAEHDALTERVMSRIAADSRDCPNKKGGES